MESRGDLVVKSNQLTQAISNLSLIEIRLMQLAVVDARETGTGITADTPLVIHAKRYASAFGVTLDAAYLALREAAKTLFERQFTLYLIDKEIKKQKRITSRWVSQVGYIDSAAMLEIILSPAVVSEITRLEAQFTKYYLEQTSQLTSAYAVRLYELLIQWREAVKLPMFELHNFRQQLGLADDELFRMSDFKKRVLDLAVAQINQHTDIIVSYEQHKNGRVIKGFTFSLTPKKQAKPLPIEDTSKPKTIKKTTAKTDGLTHIPRHVIEKHARVGETWEQASERVQRFGLT